jgi:hypothetical protein
VVRQILPTHLPSTVLSHWASGLRGLAQGWLVGGSKQGVPGPICRSKSSVHSKAPRRTCTGVYSTDVRPHEAF